VIVTKKGKPYHSILVVKIGYLVPELYDLRGDWLMALTPGGVDQDLARLPYERITRPMFPLDKSMKDPDLSARLVPSSDNSSRRRAEVPPSGCDTVGRSRTGRGRRAYWHPDARP